MARSVPTKYVFVTGGVLSGLGKGVTAASLGALFKSRGFSVNIQKLDPYLNVDAGTLNPGEHGECFVTDDGAETDLDLGHYERFLDINLTQSSSVMSGRVLRRLIEDERSGKYLGKTVQVVPHFTEALEKQILDASKGFNIHITEIGGTVGDYESPAFFEAIRSLGNKLGRSRVSYVQVVYLPYLNTSNEIKTKPAQNAVRDLRSMGVMPDVLICRSSRPAGKNVAEKLSQMTGINIHGVALLPNAKSIYQVPMVLHEAGIDGYILNKLKMPRRQPELNTWRRIGNLSASEFSEKNRIALVAKYMSNEDTYFSVIEAIKSVAWNQSKSIEIEWIDSEQLNDKNARKILDGFDGILVPGGFGSRGVEGKIVAASYAMKANKPYLGLCLGLQVAVIAFARLKLKLKEANSLEADPSTPHPVIFVMDDQGGKEGTGGTMRLGSYSCSIKPGTLARKLYKKTTTNERHRHRYEVNNLYKERMEKNGLVFSGIYKTADLAEIIELKGHPFFIASQFHPEFKSRPMRPHPLFEGFISALQNH